MEDKLKVVKDILQKYHQEHLIQFYDELSLDEREFLIQQILSTDFEEISNLYEMSKFNVLDTTEEVEPLSYFVKNDLSEEQIQYFSNIGEEVISSGKVAVITLAGGQGSRLGFRGPKGTFELDTKPKISLFEVLCNYLKSACQKYHTEIMWYIMTSTENHEATIRFFEQKNFFGYPRENIFFFSQGNLPLVDTDGKLVLEETYKIKTASNGNGDLFYALKVSGLINNMEQKKIEWLFVGGIDNVLLDPLDSVFIGMTLSSGNIIASKTLFKEDPSNLSWVFARREGVPAIADCENFVNEISQIKDANGNYLYREMNMLAHLFHINALKIIQDQTLPYHRAFRRSPFVNYEGMKQVPDKPNIYKFEKFVFDAFSFFDDILLLRVDAETESAPIKDFNGPCNPEVAKKKYEKYVLHKEIDLEDDD